MPRRRFAQWGALAVLVRSVSGWDGVAPAAFQWPPVVPEPGVGWPPPEDEPGREIPLYTDMGDLHVPLGNSCPAQVQQYFDQGLRFIAAFDIVRAVRSFRAAKRRAGSWPCAMCIWGEALALGPNLNAFDEPRVLGSVPLAYQRAQEAKRLQDWLLESNDGPREFSKRDAAVINALTQRFAPTAAEFVEREPELRQAYATSIDEAAQSLRNDPFLLILASEGWMATHPWDYWVTPSQARPEIAKAMSYLEEALELEHSNGWAVHLYVHITEASKDPGRAQRVAKELPSLLPGSPHIVHMAFHTLMHTGGFLFSAQVNTMATEMPRQVYPMHNLDTMAWLCRIEGRSACADAVTLRLQEIGALWAPIQPRIFETGFPVSRYAAQRLLTLVAFGRDAELLGGEAHPPESADRYWRAIWHFAVGVASARSRLLPAALSSRTSLQAERANIEAEGGASPGMPPWAFGNFGGNATWGVMPVLQVLAIAEAELDGHIATAQGRHDDAAGAWRSALAAEAALPYDEPPTWYLPVAGRLGAALLAAGRAQEAASVYNQSLAKYPHDGWILFGLMQACQQTGGSCGHLSKQFSQAWRTADVALKSSSEVVKAVQGLSASEFHSGSRVPSPVAAVPVLSIFWAALRHM